MNIAIKIAILLTGIWAAMLPTAYGVIFIVVFHFSAFIDFLVLGSCIVLVWDSFRALPRLIWIASYVVLLCVTNIGFVHSFSELYSSGPLPYEWLNGYYKNSVPLIALALLYSYLRWRFKGINWNKAVVKNAEPAASQGPRGPRGL